MKGVKITGRDLINKLTEIPDFYRIDDADEDPLFQMLNFQVAIFKYPMDGKSYKVITVSPQLGRAPLTNDEIREFAIAIADEDSQELHVIEDKFDLDMYKAVVECQKEK